MGNCKYCGHAAGFLRSTHTECDTKHRQGRQVIVARLTQAITASEDLLAVQNYISAVARESFVPKTAIVPLVIEGWEAALERFLEDGLLEESEEKRLLSFVQHFGLSQTDLDAKGSFSRIVKAAVLRDIAAGIVPQRINLSGGLPVNLQKEEQVVWVFRDTEYLEDKVRREFVGRSQGISMRVMKGVYYRVGSFKGHPVEHIERVRVDRGLLVVTNRNIYFAGSVKSTRVPYAKIITFESYSNGIGLMRDAANAKAQIFVTGDGWFTYNLVANLAQMS